MCDDLVFDLESCQSRIQFLIWYTFMLVMIVILMGKHLRFGEPFPEGSSKPQSYRKRGKIMNSIFTSLIYSFAFSY